MSKSTVIEKTNDEVGITAEDINEGPVVDLGQLDPVSIYTGKQLEDKVHDNIFRKQILCMSAIK